MNIGSLLTKTAGFAPERVAVIYGDLRRTYREMNARADRLAAALEKAGVGKGDRVAILQQNGPELLESLFGILKAGATAVPINARSHPREYSYIIGDSGAEAIIFTENFVPGLEAVRAELPKLATFVGIGTAPEWAQSYESFLSNGSTPRADAERAGDDVAWLF